MGDGQLDGMPDQASSAMPISGDRAVTLSDITAVFTIYLGRTPEDPAQQEAYWETRQLSELLRVFAGSVEFGNIQNVLVDSGILAGGETLSRTDRDRANFWLSGMIAGHSPAPFADWADLILSAVTSPELAAMGGPVLSGEALTVLTDIVERRRGTRAAGLDLVSFSADAFLASRDNRCYLNSWGDIDFDVPISRRTMAPVMLPLFTEGLPAARRSGRLTLGDWLEDTQTAALAGALTHWLWDESTYNLNRAIADLDLEPGAADDPTYLNFLLFGDAAEVSPHPLFSHYAYRTLNPGEPPVDRGGFCHFVERGEARGLRTSALFDPDFYLIHQPEVGLQIASGLFASPLEHCVRIGLAAGKPFSPDFDRHFYLTQYPEIAQGVADGTIPSAEWHYVFHGTREGRAPNPYFNPWYYTARYPSAIEEMARLGIASSLEHFLLIGQSRGWLANPPLAERAVAPDDGRALFEKRGRRAYGEILDGGIAIAAAQGPRLSVIVPVSNQADLTAGFLKAAAFAIETLRSRRGVEAEVIVVDSGSRDHTGTLLAALPNVVVVRPTRAFSFPAAVNTGAARARGDILLVVNNDIEFLPDAFDRVFAVLDDDPSVGIVGAKIVLPNETLQEVGASLDRLGNTHGLGRGVDAFRTTSHRRLIVDYASGCFFAFRRADFDALSGFEEAFAPGYYEDVDFALRMRRDLDKTTVVDTGLVVIHYENASFAKGRPATVNTSGAVRNRLLLKTRHAPLFREMSAPSPVERAVKARQALFGGLRVLVVLDKTPSDHVALGSRRQATLLKAFARLGVAFDIFAQTPDWRVDAYQDPRVAVFQGWIPGQSLQDILPLHAASYSHVWVCSAGALARHAGVLAHVRAAFDVRVICDVEALSCPEAVERMGLKAAAVDDAVLRSALASELVHPVDVDQWVATDAHDRALIEQIGLGPVVTVSAALPSRREAQNELPLADRDRILFIAPGLKPASAAFDGLEWLLSEVWPRLTAPSDAKLTLVGDWEDRIAETMLRRFGGRVDRVGAVDNEELSRLYDKTRVAVIPDRLTGARFVQVAEAALAGVPTVMTDLVARRLGAGDDATIAQARRDDGGVSFAAWISRLCVQDRTWRSQLKKQQSMVAARFDGEDVDAQVRAALDGAEARASR